MIHGPYGKQNMGSPCINKNTQNVLKIFAKILITKHLIDQDIHYKGKHFNKVVDNRFVVPYNSYLLLKFNSHINVEICSTVQYIKYLFKYCYKGHDCAFIDISNVDLN